MLSSATVYSYRVNFSLQACHVHNVLLTKMNSGINRMTMDTDMTTDLLSLNAKVNTRKIQLPVLLPTKLPSFLLLWHQYHLDKTANLSSLWNPQRPWEEGEWFVIFILTIWSKHNNTSIQKMLSCLLLPFETRWVK